MARPLRREAPGALWHVTSRGNERRPIVRDDVDRRRFLALLGETVERTAWRLYAYVLMDNHYHLLIETPEPNLSLGMCQLNGRYGSSFNRRHHRVGHLFQGRFKGVRVEREAHLLELARYIVLNPVRGGLVRAVAKHAWSSYRATVGLDPAPGWLRTRELVALFGSGEAAILRYAEFVEEGLQRGSPWEALTQQVFLGSEHFVRTLVQDVCPEREIPRAQTRHPTRPGLEDLLGALTEESGKPVDAVCGRRSGSERIMLAYLARHECGVRLRVLGDALGVDIAYVSRLAARGQARLREDPQFAGRIESVRARLRSRGREPRATPE